MSDGTDVTASRLSLVKEIGVLGENHRQQRVGTAEDALLVRLQQNTKTRFGHLTLDDFKTVKSSNGITIFSDK